ncbi:MAG: metallophosphoesterase [Bacteroidales bacterium]|nr:metallophosphoesterase [Bacteroidales bacterium]
MKRLISIAALLAAFTAGAQDRADRQSLENPESFSMILLGDPQGYVKYDINQPVFELCTAWIADNIDNLNIKAVLCTGDLVEQNENIVMNRRMLNQTSREMYEWASHCFERLDGRLPYIISPGNHDYGYRKSENGNTHYPEYFPFERNSCWRDMITSSFPNRNGEITIENAAFSLEDSNWGKMLVICTEFAPRDEVLEWALDLCRKNVDRKVIFITHSLLRDFGSGCSYTDNEPYTISPANWGKGVWEKLLAPAPNIVLALCGHTGKPAKDTFKGAPDDWSLSCAYRCDKNSSGRDVHQMMFNVQVLGGGWEGNGGDGWLRILEFLPDGRTIKVRTYSPLFGISHLTKHLAHRTGECDQFDMVIE